MRRFILSVALSVMPALAMPAQDGWKRLEDPERIVSLFNEMNSRVVTVDCSFVEEKYVDVLVDKSVSGGKYHFSAPDSVSVVYDGPDGLSISVSRGILTVVTDGRKTEKRLSSDRRFSFLADMLHSGGIPSEGWQDSFSIEAFENASAYRLLISRMKSQKKEDIDVMIDRKDMSLVSFMISDGGSDYTRFTFKDKRIVYAGDRIPSAYSD